MKSLLLAAFLAMPLPVVAETREERLAAAKDYVDLALGGFDMAAMIETMYQPILQQVAAGGATLSEAQVERIRKLFLETFTGPLTQLMQDQAGIMADMFTLSEITALRDFYATPEGKSVMAKLPQLTAAQEPGMVSLINEKMRDVMPQVLAIINGEAPPEPSAQP